jgi:hypothetical protein
MDYFDMLQWEDDIKVYLESIFRRCTYVLDAGICIKTVTEASNTALKNRDALIINIIKRRDEMSNFLKQNGF